MEKTNAPRARLIDRAVLLEHLDGDLELLHEIATIYLQTYPVLSSGIRDALASGHSEELYQAVHKLKGSVATFHAPTVLDAVLRLEEIGKSGGLSLAKESFDKLEADLQGLERALTLLLRESLATPASEDPLP